MKKIISQLFLVVFAVLVSSTSQAQTMEAIKAQMVKDWERAREYTKEYLNTMPANKYSFKAQDSIRNFAQQMLHLAAANVFFMSNVTSEKPPSWLSFTLENRTTAQQKDSVEYYVND